MPLARNRRPVVIWINRTEDTEATEGTEATDNGVPPP